MFTWACAVQVSHSCSSSLMQTLSTFTNLIPVRGYKKLMVLFRQCIVGLVQTLFFVPMICAMITCSCSVFCPVTYHPNPTPPTLPPIQTVAAAVNFYAKFCVEASHTMRPAWHKHKHKQKGFVKISSRVQGFQVSMLSSRSW